MISVVGFVISYGQQKSSKTQIARGKALYKACVNCHGTTKGVAAAPLQRIRQVRSMEWIYKMVQNPARFAYENPKAKAVFEKSRYMKPSYPTFTKSEIIAILDYLDSLPFDSRNYSHRN